jgi:hypothetical protein
MHRLIARLLPLVLIAGMLTPFATGMPMQTSGAHCNRKPLSQSKPAEKVPACHHHAMPGMADHEAMNASPTHEILDSKDCCCDHECCRSMARSQSAAINRRVVFQDFQPATKVAGRLHTSALSYDLALYRSVRAPPAL